MMKAEDEIFESTRRCLFPDKGNSTSGVCVEGHQSRHSADLSPSGIEPKRSRHSPTGVQEYFASRSTLPLHPTIVMSEDGAEVSLESGDQLGMVTPDKVDPLDNSAAPGIEGIRSNSLMDDCTLTPPSTGRVRSDRVASTWCLIPSATCVVDDTFQILSSESLEDTISSFLSNEGGIGLSCKNWQEWFFAREDEIDEINEITVSEKVDRLGYLRKRVNMKTRQNRVRQLHRDLSPFCQSPGRSPHLVRSRSFSVSDHQSAILRRSKERSYCPNSFSNVLQLCSVPENVMRESPMVLRYKASFVEDVCYDSDPEDFTRCRKLKGSPREKENNPLPAFSHHDHSTTVQEMFNKTFVLVYHPENSITNSSKPFACSAWLERGQVLNELIQPKWMWRQTNRIHSTPGAFAANKCLELLDIARVLHMPVVDRGVYPFAKPKHTFVVRNISGDEFCFEAQSPAECHLITHGLKLAIARFGAMVVATNHGVYDEFFAVDNCVPGDPPEVLAVFQEQEE